MVVISFRNIAKRNRPNSRRRLGNIRNSPTFTPCASRIYSGAEGLWKSPIWRKIATPGHTGWNFSQSTAVSEIWCFITNGREKLFIIKKPKKTSGGLNPHPLEKLSFHVTYDADGCNCSLFDDFCLHYILGTWGSQKALNLNKYPLWFVRTNAEYFIYGYYILNIRAYIVETSI